LDIVLTGAARDLRQKPIETAENLLHQALGEIDQAGVYAEGHPGGK
jgi:hypothetical protein